ncbi:MAG: hypothetical protein VB876_00720 [Pirellulales bacterium]
MRRVRQLGPRIIVACLLGVLAAVPAGWQSALAQNPNSAGPTTVEPSLEFDSRITELIRQLGAPSFGQRQRATRQLQAIGVTAKPALVQALQHDDAEIRSRARRILLAVLDTDLQRRITAFAADPSDQQATSLPGWRLFKETVGTSAVARRIYLEAVRAEPVLLESIEQTSQTAGTTLTARAMTLHERYIRNPMYRGIADSIEAGESSVCALLLATMNPDVVLDEQIATKIYQLVQHAGLRQHLDAGPRRDPIRRLVGSFIETTAELQLAYQTIWLAMHHNLKEGLVPAVSLVERRDRQPYMLQNALLCVGKLGDRRHLELVELLLEDESPVDGRIANASRPQICEIALAVSIHLAGQDPKSFGYSKLQLSTQTLFQASTLAFASDPMREQALEKWRIWRARHPQ